MTGPYHASWGMVGAVVLTATVVVAATAALTGREAVRPAPRAAAPTRDTPESA